MSERLEQWRTAADLLTAFGRALQERDRVMAQNDALMVETRLAQDRLARTVDDAIRVRLDLEKRLKSALIERNEAERAIEVQKRALMDELRSMRDENRRLAKRIKARIAKRGAKRKS